MWHCITTLPAKYYVWKSHAFASLAPTSMRAVCMWLVTHRALSIMERTGSSHFLLSSVSQSRCLWTANTRKTPHAKTTRILKRISPLLPTLRELWKWLKSFYRPSNKPLQPPTGNQFVLELIPANLPYRPYGMTASSWEECIFTRELYVCISKRKTHQRGTCFTVRLTLACLWVGFLSKVKLTSVDQALHLG